MTHTDFDPNASLAILWDTLVSGEDPGFDFLDIVDNLRLWIVKGGTIPLLPDGWQDQTVSLHSEIGNFLSVGWLSSALSLATAQSQFMTGLLCCEAYYIGTIGSAERKAHR